MNKILNKLNIDIIFIIFDFIYGNPKNNYDIFIKRLKDTCIFRITSYHISDEYTSCDSCGFPLCKFCVKKHNNCINLFYCVCAGYLNRQDDNCLLCRYDVFIPECINYDEYNNYDGYSS